MKRPQIQRTVLAVALLAIIASGCDTPAATAPAAYRPASTCTLRSGAIVMVTDLDNGRTICLDQGTRIEVYLHGSATQMWSPIRTSGSALTPAASGKNTLMIGVTGASYVARSAGTTELTSMRGPCATPSTASPTPSCRPAESFVVTVTVSR